MTSSTFSAKELPSYFYPGLQSYEIPINFSTPLGAEVLDFLTTLVDSNRSQIDSQIDAFKANFTRRRMFLISLAFFYCFYSQRAHI